MSNRIGFGFDIHRFGDDTDRPLVLAGVTVRQENGLEGHSDADVVSHAVTDALLGAANLGDIGEHFPDTDPKWKGADSLAMLRTAVVLVRSAGFTIANVDCSLVMEEPKIAPFRTAMQDRLTTTVGAPVSVKAGRAEQLGALGRVEGAACWAVALLEVVA